MSAPSETAAGDALQDLIRALASEPDRIDLEVAVLPRRLNFFVRPPINDAGKLIGKQGTHVAALSVVAAAMGDRFDAEWTFHVREPEDGARRPRVTPPADPARHDPTADLDLLRRVLEACGGPGYEVGAEPEGDAAWAFVVRSETHAEHEVLAGQRPPNGETLVSALGTLFRAVGRRQGVAYRIQADGGRA